MIYEDDLSDDDSYIMQYPSHIKVSGSSFYSNSVFSALVNASGMPTQWSQSFLSLIGTETAWIHNVISYGDKDDIVSMVLKKRDLATVHIATSIPPSKEKYEMMILDSIGFDIFHRWKRFHPFMDTSEYILITHSSNNLVETIMEQCPELGVDYVHIPTHCAYTVIIISGKKEDASTILRSFCQRPDVSLFLNTRGRMPDNVATSKHIELLLAKRLASSMTLEQVMRLKDKVMQSVQIVYIPLRYNTRKMSLYVEPLYDISNINTMI
jgi:hypothetical protein